MAFFTGTGTTRAALLKKLPPIDASIVMSADAFRVVSAVPTIMHLDTGTVVNSTTGPNRIETISVYPDDGPAYGMASFISGDDGAGVLGVQFESEWFVVTATPQTPPVGDTTGDNAMARLSFCSVSRIWAADSVSGSVVGMYWRTGSINTRLRTVYTVGYLADMAVYYQAYYRWPSYAGNQ